MLLHNVGNSGLHREDTLVQPTVPFRHWRANAVLFGLSMSIVLEA